MVQVLEDIDFILQANTLISIETKLVKNFHSTLLLVCLHGSLEDLSEGTFTEDFVVVELVLILEHLHIFKRHDEVFVRCYHVVLVRILLFLLH